MAGVATTCMILLCHMSAVYTIQESMEMMGDVTVAGLFPIQEPTSDGCGNIYMASVQECEAARWVFKSLNDQNYIPGVKIGFKAFATCGSPERAIKMTNDIIVENGNSQTDNVNDTNHFVGVIGPVLSAEAVGVSRLLGSLPYSSSLIQIAYSTTSPSLSDKSMYPTFFRLVPTDKIKIEAMVQLMRELEWTYIAVFHGNDTYGSEGVDELVPLALKYGICAPVVQGFETTDNTEQLKDRFIASLRNLSDDYGNKIGGVVVFATYRLIQPLLEAADMMKSENLTVPLFIFSESIKNRDRHFSYQNGRPIDAAKGSFSFIPSQIKVDEFEQYWRNVNQNLSILAVESKTNPWLTVMYESFNNCSFVSNTCSPLSNDDFDKLYMQSDYTEYVIGAAMSMAWVVKETWLSLCDYEEPGLCSNFYYNAGKTILETARKADINLGNDFAPYFHVKAFSENDIVVNFDENNDVIIPSNTASYIVKNFRSCIDSTPQFCLENVGSYFGTAANGDGKLQLDKEQIRDYNKDETEEKWPDIRKAQCPDRQKCEDCTLDSRLNDFYHIPGDMYIIGIAPLHNKGRTPLACGGLRPRDGFDIAEAIIYAVSESKERNMQVPQGKIGVIFIDSCDDPISVQQKILSLHRFGIQTDTGQIININDKVIGYIGAFGSSISISIADIATRLGYVQISYGSASPLLSDRYLYPYFLRITSSSDAQAPVILDVIKQLGSEYIQILYSEEAYGEGGRDSILGQVENFKMCVANVLGVSDGDANYFHGILDNLRQFKNAKIVVLFLREHIVPKLLNVIVEGEFLFVGSEGWGKGDILKDAPKAKGSITVAQVLPIHDGFTKHMNNLSPTENEDNPWLKSYMELRQNCSYPWSFDKSMYSGQCRNDARLDSRIGYTPDTWSPFAIHTVHALLAGANKALEQLCNTTKSLCKEYRENPLRVADILRTVRLDLTQTGTPEFVFNENGDGSVGYMIYNVREGHDGNLVYGSPIGRWINGRSEYFWEDQLVFPGNKAIISNCDGGNTCSECFHNSKPSKDNELSFIIVIVVLSCLLALTIVIMVAVTRRIRKASGEPSPYLHVIHNGAADNAYCEGPSEHPSTPTETDKATSVTNSFPNAAFNND